MTRHPTTVRYGRHSFRVHELVRESGVPSVQIRVHPDCRVEALVPEGQPRDRVLKALNKRAPWIHKQVEGFRALQANTTPRSYIGGESHLYLGRRYSLRVVRCNSRDAASVKLKGGDIEVVTPFKSRAKIKMQLEAWYRERAKVYFAKRLAELCRDLSWVKEDPNLRVRLMKKQWGNCSRKGILTMNVHLVKAPRVCIDYVILHELCHLVERNHGKRFYRLLDSVCSDRAATKERLDKLAATLL